MVHHPLLKHPKAALFTFINSHNSESADHHFHQVAAKALHEVLQDAQKAVNFTSFPIYKKNTITAFGAQ